MGQWGACYGEHEILCIPHRYSSACLACAANKRGRATIYTARHGETQETIAFRNGNSQSICARPYNRTRRYNRHYEITRSRTSSSSFPRVFYNHFIIEWKQIHRVSNRVNWYLRVSRDYPRSYWLLDPILCCYVPNFSVLFGDSMKKRNNAFFPKRKASLYRERYTAWCLSEELGYQFPNFYEYKKCVLTFRSGVELYSIFSNLRYVPYFL